MIAKYFMEDRVRAKVFRVTILVMCSSQNQAVNVLHKNMTVCAYHINPVVRHFCLSTKESDFVLELSMHVELHDRIFFVSALVEIIGQFHDLATLLVGSEPAVPVIFVYFRTVNNIR